MNHLIYTVAFTHNYYKTDLAKNLNLLTVDELISLVNDIQFLQKKKKKTSTLNSFIFWHITEYGSLLKIKCK